MKNKEEMIKTAHEGKVVAAVGPIIDVRFDGIDIRD